MSLDTLPFQSHLGELRRRLITCLAAFCIAFIVCYAFSRPLVAILFYPVRQALPPDSSLVFTALTEGFMTYIKVAFWSALIVSTPVILYQIWGFLAPGLYENEKRILKKIIFLGLGLFLAGGIFGYWIIMPAILTITLGYANQGLEALPRLQNYLLFALKTIFIFGLIFEIPFLMAIAGRSGLIGKDYFKKNRKLSYLALYILAVVIVPTDLFSQLLLFGPLVAMFEIGICLTDWFISEKSKSE